MASNPYVNKVVYGNSTLIDLSTDTATQADVAQGKYFHLPTGERVQGTASGGGGTGGITQDQDGYLVLSPDGGGGGGSTGLEYETGTFTPSSDITTDYTISFTDTHTAPPFFFAILYADSTALVTERTAVGNVYFNSGQAFSPFTYGTAGTSVVFGYSWQIYSANTVPATGSGSALTGALYTSYNDQTASAASNSRYWVTETGFTAYANGRAFKANKTYKWIAVWAPTT